MCVRTHTHMYTHIYQYPLRPFVFYEDASKEKDANIFLNGFLYLQGLLHCLSLWGVSNPERCGWNLMCPLSVDHIQSAPFAWGSFVMKNFPGISLVTAADSTAKRSPRHWLVLWILREKIGGGF